MAESRVNLPGYSQFHAAVQRVIGIDLDCYKSAQVERRLGTIMRRAGANDLAEYAHLLSTEPDQLREFQDNFLINVSEWVRNPEKWQELRTVILPELLRQSPSLKIWSAGCSIGCEPYSLAMMLEELDPNGRHEIIASDLDDAALAFAKAGLYPERDIKGIAEEKRSLYFTRTEDGLYLVKPNLRKRITFEKRNLLSDAAPSGCHLILCRNVVIYFTEQTKDQLYRKFYAALKPGGILWLGSTELILQSRDLGFSTRLPFFYQAVKA